MPRVAQIKTEYGEMQAKLLNELFELPAKAAGVDISMRAEVKERLGERDFSKVRAAEGAQWAEEERSRIKTEYVRLDLERQAAVEEAVKAAERALSPQEASAEAVLRAAGMSEQELIDAMDAALGLGAAGEDAALLCFQMARQRDLEEAVAHAISIREDWADLYQDIAEGANDPELGAGDRFEVLAQRAPSGPQILEQDPGRMNTYPRFRG